MIFTRWKKGEPREGRVFLVLDPDNAMTAETCPACGKPLGATAPVQLLAIGPMDSEDMELHNSGRWYSAVALVFHAHCLGTETVPPQPSRSRNTVPHQGDGDA